MSETTNEYLSKFRYSLIVKAGPVYSTRFKEFNQYCNETLGIRYRDWHMLSSGKNEYRLLLKDNKSSLFLSLKFSDLIVDTIGP